MDGFFRASGMSIPPPPHNAIPNPGNPNSTRPFGGRHFPHAKFTADEDQALIDAVVANGQSNWHRIARLFAGRTARQCKERWTYYLSPDLNHAPFTPDEDRLLVTKQLELGPKWVFIATFFHNRTDAMLKNRWQQLQRRERQRFPLWAANPRDPRMHLLPHLFSPWQRGQMPQIPPFRYLPPPGLRPGPANPPDWNQAPSGVHVPRPDQP
jgi:hypothetical protein